MTEHSDISTLGLKRKAPSNLTGNLLKLYSAQHSRFQLKLSCSERKLWHILSSFEAVGESSGKGSTVQKWPGKIQVHISLCHLLIAVPITRREFYLPPHVAELIL